MTATGHGQFPGRPRRHPEPENHISPLSLRTKFAAAARPVISLLICSNRSPRLARAIVHQPDRGIRGQRTADHGRGILADRLVHIIFAIVLAANRPFEADRGHRAGADLRIALGLDHLGRSRLAPRPRPSPARGGFPDDRECWRWPQAHDRSGRFDSRSEASGHCAISEQGNSAASAEFPSSLPNKAEFCQLHAQTGGNLPFQGRTCSS